MKYDKIAPVLEKIEKATLALDNIKHGGDVVVLNNDVFTTKLELSNLVKKSIKWSIVDDLHKTINNALIELTKLVDDKTEENQNQYQQYENKE